ncbi:hypothetical protein BCR41DRAFT_395878 [Lobosporangium transversale]|uniref:Uncharacterized protein n=1 Tax=Lobosporangium transversale TaxID=64571 RepID=A0A1Y2GR21_9FUNG|nr:hypothetical protein BCR41DRAFT_395878 [Lobosporangium transversale]ORZ17592.1 hypothetical protein BCR41DRAFT_395878 [Lobosporangium transversale]|eukprot:XP_021881979.1 hypothetical protein BCR41DRAFT_395878 [Lobosporangium transversale]
MLAYNSGDMNAKRRKTSPEQSDGITFEFYVQRMLRIGNCSLKVRNFDDNTEISINPKAKPKLFQFTTNKDHGIKSESFKKFLRMLQEEKWIRCSKEVAFIFVVPQDRVKEFKKQKYKTEADGVDSKPTKELLDVKQYVMRLI